VEKYSRAGQATDGTALHYTYVACLMYSVAVMRPIYCKQGSLNVMALYIDKCVGYKPSDC